MANKKSKYPALEIFIITVLVILIAAMLIIYFSFNKSGDAPKIFGYYIYRTHAVNMEPAIPSESAVFASEKEKDNIGKSSVVLCKIDDNLTIIRVVEKLEDDNGEYYIVRFDTSPSTETYKIPAQNVIAKAVYYDEFTGTVLNFATSEKGIVCLAIVPSILIVLYEVIKIIVIQKKSSDKDKGTLDDLIEEQLTENNNEKNSESPLMLYSDYIPKKSVNNNSVEEKEEKLPAGRFKTSADAVEKSDKEKAIDDDYIGRFVLDFKSDKDSEIPKQIDIEKIIPKAKVNELVIKEEKILTKVNANEKSDTAKEEKTVNSNQQNVIKKEEKTTFAKSKNTVNIDDLFKMIDDEQSKINRNS